jgi:L-threonylcarbamoyladenylate synthase
VVDVGDLSARARMLVAGGARVGVLAPELPDDLVADVVVIGVPADADEYARSLYARLREADAREVDVLLAVPPPEVGIGAAVADRLRRAAGQARDE